MVQAIPSASISVTDTKKLNSLSTVAGEHTIRANASGISIDGLGGVSWGTMLGDGETLKQKIEAGKSATVELASGLAITMKANPRATIEGAIAAFDGTTISLNPTGNATVGSYNFATDAGGDSAYSPDRANSSWSIISSPKGDDALADVGVTDLGNVSTTNRGEVTFGINKANIDDTKARFSFNGQTIEYQIDSASADELKDLLTNNKEIKAGDAITTIKFTHGDSELNFALKANRDFDSKTLFNGERFTASFNGMYSEMKPSGLALKSIGEGNVAEYDTIDTFNYVAPSGKEAPKNQWWIQSNSQDRQGMFIEIENINTTILGIDNMSVLSFDEASDAIERSQKAIDKVTANRSKIGAQQNRLEHTINNLNNTSENTQAAESRIRDVDVAKEMVEFSRQNILEMMGESMMAQANNKNVDRIMSLIS